MLGASHDCSGMQPWTKQLVGCSPITRAGCWLTSQVADKLALLDEFEDRFNRQYKCV